MWKESNIKVNGKVFHYWMKQYEAGSHWGIDGGHISKLMLKRDGKIVCNYDRGWDMEPTDENGSVRGCCSLFMKSHHPWWRLFFMS